MAWENPVTTWGQAGKTVPGAGDFNRIEGNTQYLKDEVDSHKAEDASTTAKGHVQLNNTVTSTSTTQAATANAVKTVNDALTSHKAAAAPHSGHETPAGAQAKADVAEQNAKDYADGEFETKADANAHKADGASHSKTARFVIGTSTAGWTLKDCDYLCDGTADQTEINAAITALPATGGEVVILDGTYNITAKIDVTKDNVSIRGNGNATILKRMYNSTTYAEGVITLTNRSGCEIANLQIDGNGAEYTNSNNSGIYLSGSSINTITGNTCNNNGGRGIYLNYSSNNNTVTGNTCNNNSNHGIYLTSSSNNNTVTGNTCNNNSTGFYLESSNNTITGNTYNNNNYGIYIRSSNNTITGNTCNNNNTTGIYLNYSSNNTVIGNTCIRGTGLATDYTESQYTIRLNGTGNSYNLIAMNNCMGKAPVVGGGTGNSVWGNKFDETDDLP